MSMLEIIELFASGIAIVLGVLAVWLSLYFFRMSSQQAEGSRKAARDIASSVERLEALFDKLYSTIFSLASDSMSDIRQHWLQSRTQADNQISQEVVARAEEKVATLKRELSGEIKQVFHRVDLTEAKVVSLSEEMESLVDRAIRESRQADSEALSETVQQAVKSKLRAYAKKAMPVTLDIVFALVDAADLEAVVTELFALKKLKLLNWEGDKLTSETLIHVSPDL